MTKNHNMEDAEIMRFEGYAESILDETLYRRRWLAVDRDRLALALRKVAKEEFSIAMKKMGVMV